MSEGETTVHASRRLVRLRVGLLLFLLSWFPFAQIVISIAHHQGDLTSDESAQEVRLAIWAVQYLVGFVGLWMAGSVAVAAAKADGWRRLPSNLWRLLREGEQAPPTEPTSEDAPHGLGQ